MVYYVYVIRLDEKVITSGKFKKHNPEMNPDLSCYYVGQSCRDPEIRFWQHKKGYKSNRFVKEYGLGLCPQFYDTINPIHSRRRAEKIEKHLTIQLRQKGHGVWSN